MFMTDVTAFTLASTAIWCFWPIICIKLITSQLFGWLLLSTVNPTIPCVSLPLISHREWIESTLSALLTLHEWTCTVCVIFCSSDCRICVDFTSSLTVMMLKLNNFLPLQVNNMKTWSFTWLVFISVSLHWVAPPTLNPIGPKSLSPWLYIQHQSIFAVILLLCTVFCSQWGLTKKITVLVFCHLFYLVELLICLFLS